jgi:hypothetical protein
MDKVFFDENGKMYKGEKANSPSHSEMNFPPQDILDALNETPCTREEMIGRINHPDFPRKQAVLADERDQKEKERTASEEVAIAALAKAKEKEKQK